MEKEDEDWAIIRAAKEAAENLSPEIKFVHFFEFLNSNCQTLKEISCQKIKDTIIGKIIEIFEIDSNDKAHIKMVIEIGDYKFPFSSIDLDKFL